jgi:hypothetical protein
MATPFQTSLFGIDPIKYRQERAAEYDRLLAAQQSPQSRMGFAIGNLLGGVFGGEDPALSRASAIQGIYNKVAQQFPDQTSPEFYKALANAIPAEYADAKIIAAEKAQAAEAASLDRQIKLGKLGRETTEAEQKELKFFTENPDQATFELQRLAKIIEADPNNQAALARYEKIATAGTTGAITRAGAEEKADVDIKKNKALINKYEKDLEDAKKFGPEERLNMEIDAARLLLKGYGVDPSKPLQGQNIPASILYGPAGQSIVQASQKALQKKTTESSVPYVAPQAGPAAAPAGAPGVIDFSKLPSRK